MGFSTRQKPKNELFHVESAVKVLRSSGLFKHAILVAQFDPDPIMLFDILVDDLDRCQDVINCIEREYTRKERTELYKRYGRKFIDSMQMSFLRNLMDLCDPKKRH